jgi:hypothetical protein
MDKGKIRIQLYCCPVVQCLDVWSGVLVLCWAVDTQPSAVFGGVQRGESDGRWKESGERG